MAGRRRAHRGGRDRGGPELDFLCSYDGSLAGDNEGRYCVASGVSSGFDGGPTGVERNLLSDPVLNLESPAVSPEGRLAAVVRAADGVQGEIGLYDLETGALVRMRRTLAFRR